MQSIPVLQIDPFENPLLGVIALLIFKECQKKIKGKTFPTNPSTIGNLHLP